MKHSTNKLTDVNFLLENFIAPLAMLILYCLSFGYISSLEDLKGVNFDFVTKVTKYLIPIFGLTFFLFVLWLMTGFGGKLILRKSTEKHRTRDLILLIIPLTPTIQYIVNNVDILSGIDIISLLVYFLLFSIIYIYLAPTLLFFLFPPKSVMLMGTAFVFTIVSMPSLTNYFSWYETGVLGVQVVVLFGVFTILWFLYNSENQKNLNTFLGLFFFINTLFVFFPGANKASTNPTENITTNKLFIATGGQTPAVTPSIYLLVYDAYVSNETMMSYGIDNEPQENYLIKRGFTLYPHTYSLAGNTVGTMSRVLNASSAYFENKRIGVAGDGVVQKILKTSGYQTYGIFPSDYMFRGYQSYYDYSIPEQLIQPYTLLIRGMALGEFRFNIENTRFTSQDHASFVQKKLLLWETMPNSKVFVYMHTNLPSHSQNSGVCLPNETELYQQRLEHANIEMKDDINSIINVDPKAIIIVAGDHGPYLTKNCHGLADIYENSEINRLDVQDRYGTFLAIRWPTAEYEKYDEITVIQDLFPAIFAYMYEDKSILSTRVPPITVDNAAGRVGVNNGYLVKGINDGEPLFLKNK